MRGDETVIRLLNQGSGPAAMHLHGSPTHSPWDGWAEDTLQPGEYKDYYYPNNQAGPLWYHDHVEYATAPDVYYGQAGAYIIFDPDEDALGLPMGDYDIPLSISDKAYQANGDLASPTTSDLNFFGDIIHVNEQPWPYLAVEPRKYRLRFFCMGLSRGYEMQFVDDETEALIDVLVVASDGGLFTGPVTTNDIVISMGERYEVVIDFAPYKGKTITLKNDPTNQVGVPQYANTDKIMRFTVGDTITDNTNNGDIPSSFGAVAYPPTKDSIDHVFNFQHGGDALWTINGEAFNDINNRILARPQQGTVERWQFNYASGPGIHPAHIHLVNFQILSRTGGPGNRPVFPYESAGLKDTVFLAPGEQVEVLAIYGPWNGLYMFHCHNLIHEDNLMLDAFNSTLLEELGYKFEATQDFTDPLDPRFRPRPSAASDYEEQSILSTLDALGNLGAYKHAAKVANAESAFYATAGYPTESGSNPAPATSAPAPVSGRPTGSAHPAPASSHSVGSAPPAPPASSHPAESAPPASSPAPHSGSPTSFAHPSYTEPHHGHHSGPPADKGKRWMA